MLTATWSFSLIKIGKYCRFKSIATYLELTFSFEIINCISAMKHVTKYSPHFLNIGHFPFQCPQCPVFSTIHPSAVIPSMDKTLWTSLYVMAITPAVWQSQTRHLRRLLCDCRGWGKIFHVPPQSEWLFGISTVDPKVELYLWLLLFVKKSSVGRGVSVQWCNHCRESHVPSVAVTQGRHVGPSTLFFEEQHLPAQCAK